MEDRYEVLRVQTLDQTVTAIERWQPDAAIVDGRPLRHGATPQFMVPSIVLAGSASERWSLVRRLGDGCGWLRSDATPSALRAALDSLLGAARAEALMRAMATVSVVAVALLVIAGGLTWARLGVR